MQSRDGPWQINSDDHTYRSREPSSLAVYFRHRSTARNWWCLAASCSHSGRVSGSSGQLSRPLRHLCSNSGTSSVHNTHLWSMVFTDQQQNRSLHVSMKPVLIVACNATVWGDACIEQQ